MPRSPDTALLSTRWRKTCRLVNILSTWHLIKDFLAQKLLILDRVTRWGC
jgi:hypothetical protein